MSLAAIWEIWLKFVQVVYGIVGGITGGIAGGVDELIRQIANAIFGIGL